MNGWPSARKEGRRARRPARCGGLREGQDRPTRIFIALRRVPRSAARRWLPVAVLMIASACATPPATPTSSAVVARPSPPPAGLAPSDGPSVSPAFATVVATAHGATWHAERSEPFADRERTPTPPTEHWDPASCPSRSHSGMAAHARERDRHLRDPCKQSGPGCRRLACPHAGAVGGRPIR